MRHRKLAVAVAAMLVSGAIAGTVVANTYTAGSLSTASPSSPFSAGCEGVAQSGTSYLNAEVEPRVAVDPTDPTHAIAVWQQDRWSNGGAHGLVSAVTHSSGTTWTNSTTLAPFSICAGGTVANGGDLERASDPWVTFAPNGDAYQISLSFNDSNPDNGVLVSKSVDGGDTWSNPTTLIRENTGSLGLFVDKESITADPYSSSRVYAVWDRSKFPSENENLLAPVVSFALRGTIQFSRTTNSGSTWTTKTIFAPKANQFSIGNQIVVLPNTTHDLVDVTFLERSGGSSRSWDVDVLRSTDHGDTWSAPIKVSDVLAVDVVDPDTGHRVRTGDIIPDIAVDPSSGNLYAVWQDGRFSSPPKGHAHAGIAFSESTDGGLTWSAPVQVNKDTGTQAFTPNVQVASDGTIGVTYYDFRNNTSAAGLPTDYWFVHCHPSTQDCLDSTSWAESHVGGPFDMETAPDARGYFVGDYEGLARAGTKFLSVFGKANDGNTSNRTDIVSSLISP